jgi:hypothetical protein
VKTTQSSALHEYRICSILQVTLFDRVRMQLQRNAACEPQQRSQVHMLQPLRCIPSGEVAASRRPAVRVELAGGPNQRASSERSAVSPKVEIWHRRNGARLCEPQQPLQVQTLEPLRRIPRDGAAASRTLAFRVGLKSPRSRNAVPCKSDRATKSSAPLQGFLRSAGVTAQKLIGLSVLPKARRRALPSAKA